MSLYLAVLSTLLALFVTTPISVSAQVQPAVHLYIESGHTNWVQSVVFSPSGKFFVTAGRDNQIRVWNTTTGVELGQIIRTSGSVDQRGAYEGRGKSQGIEAVAFRLSDDVLVSVEWESYWDHRRSDVTSYFLHTYNLRTGKEVGSKKRLSSTRLNGCSVFNREGTKVGFSSVGKHVRWVDTSSLLSVKGNQQFECREDDFESNLEANRKLVEKNGIGIPIDYEPFATALSPNGKYLVAAFGPSARAPQDEETVVTVWDIENRREVNSVVGGSKTKTSLDVARSGDFLAYGEFAGIAEIFDLKRGIRRVCPIGKTYARDATVEGELSEERSSDSSVNDDRVGKLAGVSISPDGNRVAIASWYSSAYLWNLRDDSITSIDLPGNVNGIAFSPKGESLAYEDGGGRAHLVDLNTRKITEFARPLPTWVQKGFHDHYSSVSLGRRLVVKASDAEINFLMADGKTLVGTLYFIGKDEWIFTTPDGRFDTNRTLHATRGLHWTIDGQLEFAWSFEVFMRDYYEPRLLSRVLRCNEQENCDQAFDPIPPLAELNRNQPIVNNIVVVPQPGNSELVDVKVRVLSVAGRCFKGVGNVPCESGVFDLRLYRDGQIVGQAPGSAPLLAEQSAPINPTRQEFVQQWRRESAVKAANGQPISVKTGAQEITFKNIRLPKRADATQAEFTAYAFNEDRVKSATSEPTVYKLPEPQLVDVPRRRAYVVTVGVNLTDASNWHLLFAPNGARDMEKLLMEQLSSKYEVVPVQLLSEPGETIEAGNKFLATSENIRMVLSILAGREVDPAKRREMPNADKLQAATPDDLVTVYIASHGYADPKGMFYIVPSDIGEDAQDVSEELLNRCLATSEQSPRCQKARAFLQHSISSEELTEWLQPIDAGEMTLILDSCHSAAVSGPNFKPGPMGDRGFGQLSYDKGMRVLVATQEENKAWGTLTLNDRSLLTYVLTRPETLGRMFDMKAWLANAEKIVPLIFDRELKGAEQMPQEPLLFDFGRK